MWNSQGRQYKINASMDYKSTYFKLNTAAVLLHILNAIGVGIAHQQHLRHIKNGYLFVAPTVKLQWTNHALVLVDSTDNKCRDVSNSQHFKATMPALNSNVSLANLVPLREPFPDFMAVFNFSGTDLIQYNRTGNSININMMVLAFFLISALFQTLHGVLLYYYDDLPRFLHYLEYSFSSPLMVMIMAIQVGIVELFLVVSLGGLFFAMNIVGMCVEILTFYVGAITNRIKLLDYTELCWLVHFAGWVLFLFTMVPIWAQFHQVLACSENGGTPDYVYAIIIVESILFFLFGFLQIAATYEKFAFVFNFRNDSICVSGDVDMPVELLFKYDCIHALLSLVAKTILAWLLLGPALSVQLNVLKDRPGY